MLEQQVIALAVEVGEHRDAAKTALGQLPALFALEHGFQPISGRQQVAHVPCRIGQLDIGEIFNPTPVRALGLLVELHPHQLLHHLLEPMAGAVGAPQAAGHLGAENRIGGDAKVFSQGRHIKAGKVKHLLNRRVFHQGLQPGGGGLAAR